MFIPAHPTSIHETEISRVLAYPDASTLGPGAAADVDLSLFICFTNRSGSNFLADLLHATGQLPKGIECFNYPGVVRTAREQHLTSYADYCRHCVERRARNRRFVAKVSAGQLLTLARIGYLGTVFPNPRFIHIQRYDLIAQAISFALARSTHAWSSRHIPKGDERDVDYDAGKIAARIDSFTRANTNVRDFLLVNRLDQMPVLYEDLVAGPECVLKRIFAWLGLPEPLLNRGKLRNQRQSSAVKDDWYARYVAAQAAGPVPPKPSPWPRRR